MLCQSVSLAQTYDTSDVIKLRAEHAQRAYDKIGLSGRLLKQGKSYEYRYRSTQGHQFYKNENGVNSSITYRGIRFQNIDLQYDVYHDLVILNNWSLLIEKIDIVTRRFYTGNKQFSGLVNFISYKGDFGGVALPSEIIQKLYQGLQTSAKFKAPSYFTEDQLNSRIPDFRNLLLWAPDLEFNSTETVALEFFTSDDSGEYKIELNGISSSGIPIYGVGRFIVLSESK